MTTTIVILKIITLTILDGFNGLFLLLHEQRYSLVPLLLILFLCGSICGYLPILIILQIVMVDDYSVFCRP